MAPEAGVETAFREAEPPPTAARMVLGPWNAGPLRSPLRL